MRNFRPLKGLSSGLLESDSPADGFCCSAVEAGCVVWVGLTALDCRWGLAWDALAPASKITAATVRRIRSETRASFQYDEWGASMFSPGSEMNETHGNAGGLRMQRSGSSTL